MVQHIPDAEQALAPLLMSYQAGAHESFAVPPVSQVAVQARRRTLQRAATGAVAAMLLVTIGVLVEIPDRGDGQAPAVRPSTSIVPPPLLTEVSPTQSASAIPTQAPTAQPIPSQPQPSEPSRATPRSS